MSEWKLIDENTPRDRNVKIDLWLHNRKTGRQYRVPDSYYGKGWQSDGLWICGKHYLDDEGDWCLDPTCEDAESIVATHWMPLPDPPPHVKGESE